MILNKAPHKTTGTIVPNFASKASAVNPRIFILGCSRSGTTLLQTLIASHSDVTTFPETNFFLRPTIGNLRARIGGLLKVLSRVGFKKILSNPPISYKKRVNTYLSILDRITLHERNKCIWVEKTPRHIFNVDIINKYVPNSLNIFIIRDGREVVASVVKRAKEYGKQFKHQDINYAIDIWNRSTQIIEERKNKENSCVVKYENLVNSPRRSLIRLGNFITLDYSEVNLDNRRRVLQKAKMDDEKWKEEVGQTIKNRNNKFENYFSAKEKDYICKKLLTNSFYEF